MSAQVKVKQLWEEVRNLSLGNGGAVERLPSPPSSLQFLRDYVSQNKPCLISAATLHWPASTLWTSDDSHLLSALSSSSVSVHLTPTGAADSLAPHPSSPSRLCFATAHVESMPFPLALSAVYASDRDGKLVGYAQQQNDCFRSEYSGIGGDCEPHIPWASEALGCLPDAVNLWIGNHHSETSFHKDHYENLYAVVSGEKHFLLLPPTDVHRMYIRNYPAAHYKYVKEKKTSKFSLEVEEPEVQVPWCSVNPYPSPENMEKERTQFPLFFNGPKPFEVTVKAGEILYLPSMWFHHVRQSPDRLGRTIAINYWYDMQFDIKYAYFNFVKSIPLDQANGGLELSPDQMSDPEDGSCEDEQPSHL